MTKKTLDIEADTLEDAQNQVNSQIPDGFSILNQQVITDGLPQTVKAFAETTETAFEKALSEIPKNADIVEKEEITTPERRVIYVDAIDENSADQSGRWTARQEFGGLAIVQSIKLVAPGRQGFLGIGAKLNKYEVVILQQASIKITYKTKAKLRVFLDDGKVSEIDQAKNIIISILRMLDELSQKIPSLRTSIMSYYSSIENELDCGDEKPDCFGVAGVIAGVVIPVTDQIGHVEASRSLRSIVRFLCDLAEKDKDSGSVLGLALQGQLFIDQKNFGEAIRVLEKSQKLDSTRYDVTYYLGLAYLGKRNQAFDMESRALTPQMTIDQEQKNDELLERARDCFTRIPLIDPYYGRAQWKLSDLPRKRSNG